MTEPHPQRRVLELFLLGRLPSDEMREVSRHLLEGCSTCQRASSDLWQTRRVSEAPPSVAGALPWTRRDGYDEVFDRVLLRTSALQAEVQHGRRQALALLTELGRHPAARQRLLVSNSARFQSRMLAELLLEESHEAGFDEPARARELADLALMVADALSVADCGGQEAKDGLCARAWAQAGNACRIEGDHQGAERAFAAAIALLEGGRVGLTDRARVLDLRASLLRDQRKLADSSRLLDQVIAIYQRLGQSNLLGRTLSQKASVCGEAGDLETEMVLLRRALELLDPEEEPRVVLAARHNLITALNQSGSSREAFALLFHTRPLYLKLGDRMNLLRLRWLEGEVAQGLGRLEQAVAAFREVRHEFLGLGLGYDAALASLDLAAVLLQQGRRTDVRVLAEEMVTVFASRNIHREAMGAILFFCQAAKQEQAETDLAREVAGFLRAARHDEGLRFTPTA
jgi:tetratricopeptide (TPR) repeat protein